MSKTCILCHIVFSTKKRKPTIPSLGKPILYQYISGIVKGKKCFMVEINGMADHIHLLVDLHPSLALSELVKLIKQSTHNWMESQREKFTIFDGWGKGYYAASVSPKLKDECRKYIKGQELHHGGEGFVRELQYLIEKTGLEWYPDEWV